MLDLWHAGHYLLLGRASARPQLGGQRRRCHDIYIDRPSDFRSWSLNRRLAASCFVECAHLARWIDTNDACGNWKFSFVSFKSSRASNAGKNPCKNFCGRPAEGQIWSETVSVTCSQYKTIAYTCKQLWTLSCQFEILGWDLPKFVGSPHEMCAGISAGDGWVNGSASKGHLGKNSLWANGKGGREAILGGEKLQQERFTSSIWQKQRRCQRQALTSAACMFQTGLR